MNFEHSPWSRITRRAGKPGAEGPWGPAPISGQENLSHNRSTTSLPAFWPPEGPWKLLASLWYTSTPNSTLGRFCSKGLVVSGKQIAPQLLFMGCGVMRCKPVGGAASWLLRQESRSWMARCLGAGRAAALPLPSAAGGKAVWKVTSSLILKVKLLYIVFKSCAKNYALILMIRTMWQMVERFYSLSKKNTENTHAKDTQVFMHHPLHWLFRFFIIRIK